MICPIRMNSHEDVVRVSDIVANSGIEMSVSYGSTMIDPRSILGLFAFIGKDALLVAPDNLNPKYFMKLVKKMGVAA